LPDAIEREADLEKSRHFVVILKLGVIYFHALALLQPVGLD